MKQNRKKAFTLSELLLTLAIIGVVAAITIPQLVIEMQKKQAGMCFSLNTFSTLGVCIGSGPSSKVMAMIFSSVFLRQKTRM